MERFHDASFSDVFVCDGELDFHDYYYDSPFITDANSSLFRVHRTGIDHKLPNLFQVERSASMKYCEIFCILSGQGDLQYGDKHYELHTGQLVLLPAFEAHKYRSDPACPMGKIWLEIYGANTNEIVRSLVERYGPVLEGPLFPDVCAQVSMIQQQLIMDQYYQPSVEIYRLLYTIMQSHEADFPLVMTSDHSINYPMIEAYINAHMSRTIRNSELASVCGLSLQHFMKQFRARYGLPPQEYIMQKRISKAKYALLNTGLSMDAISESLGFCNTSHFIRRFSAAVGISPAMYRKRKRKI